MVRLDKCIGSVCAGTVFGDHEFELESMDCALQQIIRTRYRGVYVICDNGYLDWSCTVPPFTMTSMQDEIRWLKWLESMRKDVEWTFGILASSARTFLQPLLECLGTLAPFDREAGGPASCAARRTATAA